MAFQIIRNDITKVSADAVVNTANPKPKYVSGTDYAIYMAAGADECDSVGTALNFNVMSKMVSCARACRSAEDMGEAFDSDEMLAPIRTDYKKRHRA